MASSDAATSWNIVIVGNYIYDGGNNLKDRSAGTEIRYNWIEGGNRQLDLVDGEDSSLIRGDPSYHSTYVYGNILYEYANDGNRQMVHYGGDSGNTATYRKGTLYFYNNTLVSARMDRTTLFRASTKGETVDARNNIFYSVAAGTSGSLADDAGVFNLSHNWIKPGWITSFGNFGGTVNDDGTMVTGSAPGFVDEAGQDYHLASASQCVNAGGNLNAAVRAERTSSRAGPTRCGPAPFTAPQSECVRSPVSNACLSRVSSR